MKFYDVGPENKHDTRGFILNTKEPFQVEFKHSSYKKTKPIILDDCNLLTGQHRLPSNVYGNRFLHGGCLSAWSSGAYRALLPVIENSVEHTIPLAFDNLTFYFVLPYEYIPATKREDGYLYIPTFQEVYEKIPPNCNFFTIGADPRIMVTEKFIHCVEENKLKGFGFRLIGESD